jgi:hypothetical protein
MVRGPLDLHPGLVQVLRAGGPVPDQVVRASSVVPAWQATLTSRRSPQRLRADRDPLVRLRPVHHPRRAPRPHDGIATRYAPRRCARRGVTGHWRTRSRSSTHGRRRPHPGMDEALQAVHSW